MKRIKKLAVFITEEVLRFIRKCSDDNVSAIAGQSAFFIILSFVPFVMFLIAVSVLVFGDPTNIDINSENEFVKSLSKLMQYLYNTLSQSSNAVIISAIITLWSAGKGIYIITDGIQRIYQIPIKGLWVFRRIYAMGYTIVMLLILMISFVFILLNSALEYLLTDNIKDLPGFAYFVYVYRYVLIGLVLSVAMTFAMKLFLRRKLSDKRWRKFRVLYPGMLFTTISWNVLTSGMGLYIKYFGVNSLYGQLGAVIYMMIWVYFAMYLLLIGIQINYMYREVFYNFKLKELFTRKSKKLPEASESQN